MELKIKTPTIPQVIEFNFEDLKAEIEAKAAEYTGLVYTDDKIKEAKADVANLRKFTKVLNDERRKIKTECLKPYEEFEEKINILTGIVNEPITTIANQISAYEEQKKAEKKHNIEEYWQECEEMGNVPDSISLMKIFDEKWLNASVSMKSVQEAIDTRLSQIRSDILTLDNLHEFGFEAKQEYLRSLDLGKAIAEGQRLADIQKRKSEFEKTQAAKLAEITAEEKKIATPEKPVESVYHLEFWADLTIDQASELKTFFEIRNINFGQIER